MIIQGNCDEEDSIMGRRQIPGKGHPLRGDRGNKGRKHPEKE